MKTCAMKNIFCLLIIAMVLGISCFAAMQAKKYDVHDRTRENPLVITPAGQPGQPPSDAIVLFDGSRDTLDSQ
jgi:hypothetical protein